MKRVKLTLAVLILCLVVASGVSGAFAVSGYESYLKYMQPYIGANAFGGQPDAALQAGAAPAEAAQFAAESPTAAVPGAASDQSAAETDLNEKQIIEQLIAYIEAYISATAGSAPSAVLINVTSPGGDSAEVVYKGAYSICGVRDESADPASEIILFLTKYDLETGGYAQAKDINGETRWTVGSNGVFARSVLLDEGENIFAIAACPASVINSALADGRDIGDADVQVVWFTISYRAQNAAEKIGEVFKELTLANILKEIQNQ